MMSKFTEALNEQFAEQPRSVHPKGWAPGVVEEGDTAEAVSLPMPGDEPTPSNDDLIRGWDMDPEVWEIVGEVNVRRWQRYDMEWLRYFKANLRRKLYAVDQPDIDELCEIALRSSHNIKSVSSGDGKALVICVNDWQLGKCEQGRGSEETVARIKSQIDQLPGLLAKMRPDQVVIANVGDLTERVAGHYPSQSFTVDLDERQQQKLARRLLFSVVDTIASYVDDVLVVAVPCNHGENRNGAGKAQTTASDNLSLTLIENIEEICSVNPERFDHVKFEYAPNLVHVTDVQGITIGVTHGHQFPSSKNSMGTITNWWRDQIMGMQPVAAAHMLLTAHLHHFQISEEPGRTVLLCPANDAGSYWFTSKTGKESPPGMVTFGIGLGYGDPLKGERCWGDLQILTQIDDPE